MKQIIIVNIHSNLDVITNSSSEIFVISNNTIDSVKTMLEFMLKHWNEMAAKGCFGEYYAKNERFNFKGKKTIKPIYSYEDVFGDIYIYTKEMYDNKNPKYRSEWEIPQNIGKIFINSSCDNSIPPELMDWIESAFGYSTQRFHIG